MTALNTKPNIVVGSKIASVPAYKTLIINWPEETLDWNHHPTNNEINEIVHIFEQLKRNHVKLIYVYHNNASHVHKNYSPLYQFLSVHSDYVIHLNSSSYNRLRNNGTNHVCGRHPKYFSELPPAKHNGLLVFGSIRTKLELSIVVFAGFACATLGREMLIGSFPNTGRFSNLLYNIMKAIHPRITRGKLIGPTLLEYWERSSTVLVLRSQRECNSGVLVKAISEGRYVLSRNFDAISDERTDLVSLFSTPLELFRAISTSRQLQKQTTTNNKRIEEEPLQKIFNQLLLDT